MADSEAVERYITYPQYTTYNGFEILWPLEISEEILKVIMDRVERHFQDKKEVNSELCKYLKEELELKFGKYWHVFIGKNFGSYSVQDKYKFLFFKYRSYSFLIYKTTC